MQRLSIGKLELERRLYSGPCTIRLCISTREIPPSRFDATQSFTDSERHWNIPLLGQTTADSDTKILCTVNWDLRLVPSEAFKPATLLKSRTLACYFELDWSDFEWTLEVKPQLSSTDPFMPFTFHAYCGKAQYEFPTARVIYHDSELKNLLMHEDLWQEYDTVCVVASARARMEISERTAESLPSRFCAGVILQHLSQDWEKKWEAA